MKRICALLLIIAMIFSMAGCGDKNKSNVESDAQINSGIEGTWQVSYAVIGDSKFSVDELKAMGDYSISNMCLVFKDGGVAVGLANGVYATYEWTLNDGRLMLDDVEGELDKSGTTLTLENDEYAVVFEKTSNSQDISEVSQGEDTPSPTPEPTPTPTPTITEKPEDEVTEEALIGIWELTEIEMFREGARIIYDPRIYCDPPINMLMILNKNGGYSLYDEGEWSEDASWSIQDDYIDIDGDYVLFEDGYLNDAVELDENDDGFTYYIMRFTKVSNSTDIEAYLAGTLPSTTVEQTENQTTSVSGVTPEFKATMDAYEEFFDEYIAFMKKYKESDNSTAMLADYLKFLGEYAEMIEAMDDIDDTELSTADSLYYAEVQLRISQKLLEAASDT